MPTTIIELDSPTGVDGRQVRAVTFQAVRLEYVASTLRGLGLEPAGLRALVVGGGRGLLARGLARTGIQVTSADPSPAATELAREAAGQEGVEIDFVTEPAERLGFLDGSFDMVFCADTFEITDDLDAVLGHVARLLRPGGVLVYDTVNLTPVSRLIYLWAFQRIPVTRIMPRDRYSAARLRRPADLTARLAAHGLANHDISAFRPRSVRTLVTATLALRKGRISELDLPRTVDMVLTPDGPPVVTYLGYALKA